MENKTSNPGALEHISSIPRNEQILLVRIFGATVDQNFETLLDILEEKNSEGMDYCTLSGIFLALTTEDPKKQEFKDRSKKNDFMGKLPQLIDRFEKILIVGKSSKYPVVMLQEEKISKEDFWFSVWGRILSAVLKWVFTSGYNHESRFECVKLAQQVMNIGENYDLFAKSDFSSMVQKVALEAVDKHFTSTFSNSVNTVRSSERAAVLFFMEILFFSNKDLSKTVQTEVTKRKAAWIQLEFIYKMEERKIVRGKLLDEMTYILKSL